MVVVQMTRAAFFLWGFKKLVRSCGRIRVEMAPPPFQTKMAAAKRAVKEAQYQVWKIQMKNSAKLHRKCITACDKHKEHQDNCKICIARITKDEFKQKENYKLPKSALTVKIGGNYRQQHTEY